MKATPWSAYSSWMAWRSGASLRQGGQEAYQTFSTSTSPRVSARSTGSSSKVVPVKAIASPRSWFRSNRATLAPVAAMARHLGLDDAAIARGLAEDGYDLALTRAVADAVAVPVVASGGVTTLDDLRALRELVPYGVEGAIIGSALYKGTMTLADALDVAGRPE